MAKIGNGRRLPETLTDEEREAILRQPNRRYPTGLRNLALLRVMLDAGLRNAEVRGLRDKDMNWNTGRLKVMGKGKKERIVYLGEECLEIVRQWRERRSEMGITTGFLFCTLDGMQVSERYLQQMVKRYAQKAGIEKDIHPHSLRHTFATDIYRDTKSLRLTQKALGHSNISTTTIYTHIVDTELEEAMKGFRQKRKKDPAV